MDGVFELPQDPKGIQPREDFPSLPRFQELLQEKHLLISSHTRKYLKEEHYWPGKVIDRANLSRWQDEGGINLKERAKSEVKRLIDAYQPSRLPDETKQQLTDRMETEARKNNMQELPSR